MPELSFQEAGRCAVGAVSRGSVRTVRWGRMDRASVELQMLPCRGMLNSETEQVIGQVMESVKR